MSSSEQREDDKAENDGKHYDARKDDDDDNHGRDDGTVCFQKYEGLDRLEVGWSDDSMHRR